MAAVTVSGPQLGNALQELLVAPDIVPGDQPSYQTCKAILTYHPLGAKLAESPIKMAQSQERIIEVPGAPERVKVAFRKEWMRLNATRLIRNVMRTSRAYGIASIAMLEPGVDMSKPPDMATLWEREIAFNVFDPLNTAGSLVLNQNPNALDFQKHGDIRVGNGITYHRGRTEVVLHGDPIYIEYTSSAFGFVGRSVYQPVLFPLKSFINTLITDDLVTRKAGVFIAKIKQVSSAVDRVVGRLFGFKRSLLKEAEVGNVISIGNEDAVETLNMQNLDGAYGLARENILKNIATGADMPAALVNNETMVSGFGEGTEDAKNIARFIDDIREQMEGLYGWFDKIAQRRAWNPNFYAAIQKEFPEEYGDVPHEDAIYRWSEAFTAEWPSLLIEPDSERAKSDKVRLDALIASVDVLLPTLDPLNKARLIEWIADNLNGMKLLFPVQLDLEISDLLDYIPPEMTGGEGGRSDDDTEPKPTLHPVEAAGAKAHRLHAVDA